MNTTAPLTEQHLTLINNGLRTLHDARKVMDKAEAAGMDMTGHRETADQMEAALTGFKTNFYGVKPRGG